MFEGAFSPLHWLVVLAIAVLFFGPGKLPELGKSLGTAIRGFKDALNDSSKAPAEGAEPGGTASPAKPEPKA